MRRAEAVAVTGMGCVCAAGSNLPSCLAALAFDQGKADDARRMLEKSISLMEQSAQKSKKIQQELSDSKEYLDSLRQDLGREERARKQKSVRFKTYRLEGC